MSSSAAQAAGLNGLIVFYKTHEYLGGNQTNNRFFYKNIIFYQNQFSPGT